MRKQVVALVGVGVALAGCSQVERGSGMPAEVGAVSQDDGVSRLGVAVSDGFGDVITDQRGFTLYQFVRDGVSPPRSNCQQQCATTWPPAVVSGGLVTVHGIDKSLVGTITRQDGRQQLTVAGHPAYYYNQDLKAGDVNGQGVGQTWFALTPDGKQATAAVTGATLSAAHDDRLGTVVTDADGFTLYRFGRDERGVSHCTGTCATTWPPATVTTDITLSGVDRSAVGTITREDGSRQLTIDGWPVYGYSKDTAQGDVNGQGVGGVWFAVTPTGGKNTAGT